MINSGKDFVVVDAGVIGGFEHVGLQFECGRFGGIFNLKELLD